MGCHLWPPCLTLAAETFAPGHRLSPGSHSAAIESSLNKKCQLLPNVPKIGFFDAVVPHLLALHLLDLSTDRVPFLSLCATDRRLSSLTEYPVDKNSSLQVKCIAGYHGFTAGYWFLCPEGWPGRKLSKMRAGHFALLSVVLS